MTVAPDRNDQDQAPPRRDAREGRPDLHVVRPNNNSPDNADGQVDGQVDGPLVPPETDVELTGPIPTLGVDGTPLTPLAPWDIRARAAVVAAFKASPRWSEPPPSFAESLEYSSRGDWATSDKGAKRAIHVLATVLAFLVTYPLDLVIKFRAKPIGLVLTVVLLYLATLLLF